MQINELHPGQRLVREWVQAEQSPDMAPWLVPSSMRPTMWYEVLDGTWDADDEAYQTSTRVGMSAVSFPNVHMYEVNRLTWAGGGVTPEHLARILIQRRCYILQPMGAPLLPGFRTDTQLNVPSGAFTICSHIDDSRFDLLDIMGRPEPVDPILDAMGHEWQVTTFTNPDYDFERILNEESSIAAERAEAGAEWEVRPRGGEQPVVVVVEIADEPIRRIPRLPGEPRRPRPSGFQADDGSVF